MYVINGKFLSQRITGVQRYAREIVKELDKLVDSGEVEIAVPYDAKDVPEYANIRVVRIGHFRGQMWEQLDFPFYVKKRKAISINLCNASPLIMPGIVCLHDMKIKATPNFFDKKFLLWYNLLFTNAANRAKAIITVSEFSKREIVKYYNTNPEKIHVIPNAWQHYKQVGFDDEAFAKYGVDKGKYFFSMCSLEPNKNFKWIAEIAKQYPDQLFAVAGSINEQVFADGLGFECPPNMKLLGYISDEEAKSFMRECKAFLFPSFYEGFGIPPLEALSAGAKQIVVSDIPVMHELFQDSAYYVDPNQAIGFNVDMEGRIDKESVLQRFSWKTSACKLLELMRNC